MRKVKSFKTIIEDEIKKSKDLKKELLKSNWEDVVGGALAKKSEVMYIRKDTLFIKVENSAWLQQMQFLKKDIINKVNEYLNGLFINNIFFKVGRKTYKNYKIDFKEGLNTIDIESISLESEDIFEIKESLKGIEDIELKKKMYNLMTKNRKREIYLLKNGYKRCKSCGTLYQTKQDLCTLCEIEKEKNRSALIYSIIVKRPIIKYMEMKIIINDLDQKEFELVNKKYIDRKLNEIYVLKNEKKDFELKKTVAEYLMAKDKSKSNLLQRTELFIQSFT